MSNDHKKKRPNATASDRQIQREANIVHMIADEMVAIVKETTNDPDLIDAAREVAELFYLENALDGASILATELRLFGPRGAAKTALAMQLDLLRPHINEYMTSGEALAACQGDHFELMSSYFGWRELTKLVESWTLGSAA